MIQQLPSTAAAAEAHAGLSHGGGQQAAVLKYSTGAGSHYLLGATAAAGMMSRGEAAAPQGHLDLSAPIVQHTQHQFHQLQQQQQQHLQQQQQSAAASTTGPKRYRPFRYIQLPVRLAHPLFGDGSFPWPLKRTNL